MTKNNLLTVLIVVLLTLMMVPFVPSQTDLPVAEAAPSYVEAVIAYDMFNSASQNLNSYTNPYEGLAISGDCFDRHQRDVTGSIPGDVLDDSLADVNDQYGIIKSTNTDVFFCIADTEGPISADAGEVSAVWEFDISGATGGLTEISLDMAAMGDFEANPSGDDYFKWSVSIDGGPAQTIYESIVVGDGLTDHIYTLESGANVVLADPMYVGAIELDNDFQTFTYPITDTGSTLTLTLNAWTNGGNEAIAFQNLIIRGDVPPEAPIVTSCPANITEVPNVGSTDAVSASDADSIVNSVTIQSITPSDPGTISLANIVPAVADGGTLTADLVTGAATPVGSYTVTLQFSNDDAQTETCVININIQGTTLISSIQGSGASVTGSGPFLVQAVVVGDYQTTEELRGFFLQEETLDSDGDPTSSEGIFVFCNTCPVDVNVGDQVQVNGTASEYFGMSQLSATGIGDITVLGTAALPAPATIDLPVVAGDINAFYEQYEGMLVQFVDTLTVSEYFELSRYGQVILYEGGRPRQFTDANNPDATGYANHLDNLNRRRVILDDDDNTQNSALIYNDPVFHPTPGFSITNYLRGGDTISNLTGVLHWSYAGQSGTDAWRVRPVTESYTYDFVEANPRTPAPAVVGGTFRVASFNVLNYFTTLDSRGADSAAEFDRQSDKIVAAICALNADVVGIMEIENNTTAIQELTTRLNNVCGPYAYVDTGVIGGDQIKVALIYRTSTTSLVGNYAILDASVDPNFDSTRNRPVVAQTFQEISTGGILTVAVNHLKSKGSSCGAGDDDTATGQGNCNQTRTNAAGAEYNWLATDPTGSGDPDFLVIGDMNAYRNEDPIKVFTNGGYTDLINSYGGASAYGYVFDGQLGYLDHALANSSLVSQITGATEWHINADEVNLLDYNDTIKDAGEQSFEAKPGALPLYEPNAYRSSDHDPVLVGLNLTPAPPTLTPTEVTPTEVTPTEVTPTEVTPTEVTPTEVTPTEVTPTEVTPTEVTPTEVTPTEVTPTEVTPSLTPTATEDLTLLNATAACNGPNLEVTIFSGDGPFNITASAGQNTPIFNVGVGTTTIIGPEKWDNLTVSETSGNLQSINLGQFKCYPVGRPVQIAPPHRYETTDPFPTFSYHPFPDAKNYRVWVFDDPDLAERTVDIRENSGGPLLMQLSQPLQPGRYFWRLRARVNRIWSRWSTRWMFRINATTAANQVPSGMLSVEESSPAVGRLGTWVDRSTDLATSGSYIYTNGTPQDALTLTIVGDRFGLVYVQHPSLGTMVVEVDGQIVKMIRTTGEERFGVVEMIEGLGAGNHVVRIYSPDGIIAVDAFFVEGFGQVPSTPVPTIDMAPATEVPTLDGVATEVPPSEEPGPGEPAPTDEPTVDAPQPTNTPLPPPNQR